MTHFHSLLRPSALSVALASLFFGSPAFSQDAAPSETAAPSKTDEAPPRKMNLSVADPGVPAPRTAYVHEGFYFRTSVGGGVLSTNYQDKSTGASDGSAAFTLGADLLVGGSPSPGMALGGGVLTDIGFNQDLSGAGPVLHFLAGPFFDAFPDSKNGWHLGTMVGLSGALLGAQLPQSTLIGGGAAAWGGYDMWVAPDWSAGFNIRLTGTHSVATDASATNFSAVFLISILSH